MWYIHKHTVTLEYGGPEEGGWHYDSGTPTKDWQPTDHAFTTEEAAYNECRLFNGAEHIRRHNEEKYDYYSVLAYQSTHYSYDVSESPTPYSYPEEKPHYE